MSRGVSLLLWLASPAWRRGRSESASRPARVRDRLGSVRAGPPVVLVHGTPWSSWTWRRVARDLAKRFTVHVFDLLGFGASDKGPDQDVSLAGHGQRLAALLDHWSLDRPAVVAHDIGGAAALRAHLVHGRAVASLALVDVVALAPRGSLLSPGRRAPRGLRAAPGRDPPGYAAGLRRDRGRAARRRGRGRPHRSLAGRRRPVGLLSPDRSGRAAGGPPGSGTSVQGRARRAHPPARRSNSPRTPRVRDSRDRPPAPAPRLRSGARTRRSPPTASAGAAPRGGRRAPRAPRRRACCRRRRARPSSRSARARCPARPRPGRPRDRRGAGSRAGASRSARRVPRSTSARPRRARRTGTRRAAHRRSPRCAHRGCASGPAGRASASRPCGPRWRPSTSARAGPTSAGCGACARRTREARRRALRDPRPRTVPMRAVDPSPATAAWRV